jgi:hypothetical protein
MELISDEFENISVLEFENKVTISNTKFIQFMTFMEGVTKRNSKFNDIIGCDHPNQEEMQFCNECMYFWDSAISDS